MTGHLQQAPSEVTDCGHSLPGHPSEGHAMEWTEFATRSGDRLRLVFGSYEQLLERVIRAPEYADKSLQPLIKLARFGDARSYKGSLRNDGNVIAVTGIEGDYDGETVNVHQAVEHLERHQIKAVVFTTASHRPDKPRWRVLAPCRREVSPKDRYRLVARLNGALGGVLAAESFTLSQAYYLGRVRGVVFDARATFNGEDGSCIDELDELDQIAIGKQQWPKIDQETGEILASPHVDADTFKAEVGVLGRRLRTGDGRRDMLKKFVGGLSRKAEARPAIAAAVRSVVTDYFDPDDPIDAANIDQLIDDVVRNDEGLRERGARIRERILENHKRKAETLAQSLLVTIDEASPLEPLPTLVREYLTLDGVGMLWASPGSYKSFLALDIALCVASGLTWQGHSVVPGRVWYIAGEGLAGLRLRIEAWRTARNYKGPINFLHTRRAVTIDDEGGSKGLDMLKAEVESGKAPALIVVDTLARAMTGDESSTRDASRFVAALDDLVATVRKAGQPCCVMLVHHSRKDGDIYRGSSVLRGAADFEFEMSKTGQLTCKLHAHKVKDGTLPADAYMQGRVIRLGLAKDNHGQSVEMTSLHFERVGAAAPETLHQEAHRLLPGIRQVLANFPVGASKKVLADALRKKGVAVNDRTFNSVLEALESAGELAIDRGGKGQAWRVTDAGIGCEA